MHTVDWIYEISSPVWSRFLVRKAKSLVAKRCVSSEDHSSCLRQTGCNQACHIDHHQALLHHRRSIHHCIGGAAHSLVTAPPSSLVFFQKTPQIWRLMVMMRGCTSVGEIKELGLHWQLECDSPSEWQTGRHFSAVPTPEPPTSCSAPNLFCCPFDLGLCPVVTFDNSQAENCVLSFSNRRPYVCPQPPSPSLIDIWHFILINLSHLKPNLKLSKIFPISVLRPKKDE